MGRHAFYVVVGLISLVSLFVPANPAQAGISECVSSVVDSTAIAGQIAELTASLAAQAADPQCASKLGSADPIMVAVTAVLSGLVVAGKISDETQCNGLLNTVVAGLVSDALSHSDIAKSALANILGGQDKVDQILTAMANGGLAGLAQTPPFDLILSYLTCGCVVAGKGAEIAQKVEDLAKSSTACTSLAGDVVVGAAEYIECHLAGPCLKPGVQQYQCGQVICGPGASLASCIAAHDCFNAQYSCSTGQDPVQFNGVVFCPCPGGQGFKLDGYYKATCTACDDWGQGTDASGACISCPAKVNDSAPGGRVVSRTSCQFRGANCNGEKLCTVTTFSCAVGQKAPAWGVCAPACNAFVGQYADPTTGQCTTCADNWHPVYDSDPGKNSVGHCEECSGGQYSVSYEQSGQCQPLTCGPNGYRDPSNPHSCQSCPNGQTFVASQNKCACGDGAQLKGAKCACPSGSSVKFNAGYFTCSCPKGSTLDPKTFACKCPAGRHIETQAISASLGGGTVSTCAMNTKPAKAIVLPASPSVSKRPSAPQSDKPLRVPTEILDPGIGGGANGGPLVAPGGLARPGIRR